MMKSSLAVSAKWFPSVVLGALLAGWIDLAIRTFDYQPPPDQILVALAPFAVATPILAIVGAGLAVLSLPFAVAVVAADAAIERRGREVRDLLFGPRGKLPVAAALIFVMALVAGAFQTEVVTAIGLTGAMVTIGGAGLFAAGGALGAVVYRLLVWQVPKMSGPHEALFFVLAVTQYVLVMKYGELATPYLMWPGFIAVTMTHGVGLYLLVGRGPRTRRLFGIAAALLCMGGGIQLLVSDFQGAATSAWMQRSLFGLGAKDLVVAATDIDGDGYSHLFGDGDCAPWDPEIRPLTAEIVGNGVDDNCAGGDLAQFEAPPTHLPAVDARQSSRRNVFIITVDTLRADYVGRRYGDQSLTPSFDALAAHLAFEHAYAASSQTDESMPALMTGMYPANWHQFGVYTGVERTLAEVLGEVGYDTAAITAFPWLLVALIHGFQYVDNSIGERVLRDANLLSGLETTRLALQYLDERSGQAPVFAWVHYFDPHAPYMRLNDLEAQFGGSAYVHEVHATDRAVGSLLQGLDERGLLDDSIIVFASDHGEGLGDHSIQTHVWGLYESIVRIPLAMRLPGVPPKRVTVPVSLVDVFPTLIEFLGIRGILLRDGRSLMPLLLSDADPEPRPIFGSVEDDGIPIAAFVVDGSMKLIRNYRRANWELYDLASDPGESRNLIDERPDDFARLRGVLATHRDRTFNDVLLERKRKMWDARGTWQPESYVRELREEDRAKSLIRTMN